MQSIGIAEQRQQVLAELRDWKADCLPLLELILNADLLKELREQNHFNLEYLKQHHKVLLYMRFTRLQKKETALIHYCYFCPSVFFVFFCFHRRRLLMSMWPISIDMASSTLTAVCTVLPPTTCTVSDNSAKTRRRSSSLCGVCWPPRSSWSTPAPPSSISLNSEMPLTHEYEDLSCVFCLFGGLCDALVLT